MKNKFDMPLLLIALKLPNYMPYSFYWKSMVIKDRVIMFRFIQFLMKGQKAITPKYNFLINISTNQKIDASF